MVRGVYGVQKFTPHDAERHKKTSRILVVFPSRCCEVAACVRAYMLLLLCLLFTWRVQVRLCAFTRDALVCCIYCASIYLEALAIVGVYFRFGVMFIFFLTRVLFECVFFYHDETVLFLLVVDCNWSGKKRKSCFACLSRREFFSESS